MQHRGQDTGAEIDEQAHRHGQAAKEGDEAQQGEQGRQQATQQAGAGARTVQQSAEIIAH
ncbi:MAG: hypothetical protein HZY76_16900 [Anaerolineae bacterium]|nr:MAG: hypothetical protein HZY76_16900 [Anaerolineae bacterium]